MTQATPTTQALADTIVAQLESAYGQTTPLLQKAFTRVLGKVLAGVHVLLYRYVGFIAMQMFVEHASKKETVINGRVVRPLVEWGRLIGVGDPLPATRAELSVTVTVRTQTGNLPAGSQLLYPGTGVLYLTTASVALNAPTVTVTVRASSDQAGGGGEGTLGNLSAGAVLSFANPLPNVGPTAVVAAQTVTGADAEKEDAYRARILRRFQSKPQGGAYADYQQWAEEEPGIVHAYPYTGAPGEVDVYVEATSASSGSADGIPTNAQLVAVAARLEQTESGLASRRPANAAVNVKPITRRTFDVTITGLDAPDLARAQTDISAAADEYLRSREPYIEGLSTPPRLDRITLSALSGVVDDAVTANGGFAASVTLKNAGAPLTVYELVEGEKAKLGTITFV